MFSKDVHVWSACINTSEACAVQRVSPTTQWPVPVLSRLVMRVRAIEVDTTSDNPSSDGVCVSLVPCADWILGVMVCFRCAGLSESLERDHERGTHAPSLPCSCYI